MTHSFTLQRTFQAIPKAVYRAFATPGGLMEWIANAAEVDNRVGGRFYLWEDKGYQLMGKITASEKDRLLAVEVAAPIHSHFQITLDADPAGSLLTLEHGDLEKEDYVAQYQTLWQKALDNLQSTLETGLDRRFYNRPMLGILIAGAIDETNRERYEVPEGYGIIISGPVPGMGGEKIGLQNEDVLVELDGAELRDYYALQTAVSPHKAGDIIPIGWRRSGKKHTADLPLSGRPIPVVPPTPTELAEETRQLYARLDAELAELLDGVSEAEADYRPGENEWNTKEIIAHAIATERAAQIWLVNEAEGYRFKNWASNDPTLVKAIVDIHPTLPQLTAELSRTEEQTIALIQRLPPEIVNFKAAYHNIAADLGAHGLALHTRMHYDTIKTLVAAARQT
jgi:uncharacterized protein YndB with AHSA1/START domain